MPTRSGQIDVLMPGPVEWLPGAAAAPNPVVYLPAAKPLFEVILALSAPCFLVGWAGPSPRWWSGSDVPGGSSASS